MFEISIVTDALRLQLLFFFIEFRSIQKASMSAVRLVFPFTRRFQGKTPSRDVSSVD